MIDSFELCFPLSTFLFFMETLIKINLKNLYILGISWCFHFSIFSLYWGHQETSINCSVCLRNFGSHCYCPECSQLLISCYRTYDCKHFFYRTYPFEPTDIHRNGVHQFKTNHFYCSLKNPEHKTKSLHMNPPPLPPPAASPIHVREGFPLVYIYLVFYVVFKIYNIFKTFLFPFCQKI